VKLCIDCRWIQLADYVQRSLCGHFAASRTVTSREDGSQRGFQISCAQFRLMPDGCDVDGKFWQPKQVGFE
jgi:hypothetical protein